MSSGETHGKITVSLAPVSFVSGYFASGSFQNGLLSLLGCLLGLVMEPDLDIDHITASEKRMLKAFSPLGILWIVIWKPYALAMPHRSFWSHTPVIGTAIRYVYLGIVILVPTMVGLRLLDMNWMTPIDFIVANKETVAWLFAGTAIADIGHWIADQFKPRKRR